MKVTVVKKDGSQFITHEAMNVSLAAHTLTVTMPDLCTAGFNLAALSYYCVVLDNQE